MCGPFAGNVPDKLCNLLLQVLTGGRRASLRVFQDGNPALELVVELFDLTCALGVLGSATPALLSVLLLLLLEFSMRMAELVQLFEDDLVKLRKEIHGLLPALL
mmetsp:Transcript_46041/g.142632  ORF Transcript_46041/g.142632 Transcript_46041/m.142632 type:complete len:104 (+) Transcript_46041:440-751(+)